MITDGMTVEVNGKIHKVKRVLVAKKKEPERFRFKIYSPGGDTYIASLYHPRQILTYDIDYGDGTGYSYQYPNIGSSGVTHNYAQEGEYIVTFTNYPSPSSIRAFDGEDEFIIRHMVNCIETIDPLPYRDFRLGSRELYLFNNPNEQGLPQNTPTYGRLRKITTPGFLGKNPRTWSIGMFLVNLNDLHEIGENILSGININSCLMFARLLSPLQNPKGGRLETISEKLFWEQSNISNVSSGFAYQNKLKFISPELLTPQRNPNIKDMTRTFQGCTGLTEDAPRYWEMYPNASGTGCFEGCTGLSNYSEIPRSWGGGGV